MSGDLIVIWAIAAGLAALLVLGVRAAHRDVQKARRERMARMAGGEHR
jgi:hypothetical protein